MAEELKQCQSDSRLLSSSLPTAIYFVSSPPWHINILTFYSSVVQNDILSVINSHVLTFYFYLAG